METLIKAIEAHQHPASIVKIIKNLQSSNVLTKREITILSAIYKAFI
jgi:transcriptional regulator CtsR